MLHLLPRQLPTLALMLDDIGNPSATALAQSLGVTVRTVQRWKADPDNVPRLVLAALFWLTRWGQSAVHCDLVNSEGLAQAQLRNQRDEMSRLRRELARLVELRGYGSANDPVNEDVRERGADQRAERAGVGIPAVEGVPVGMRLVIPLLRPRDQRAGP